MLDTLISGLIQSRDTQKISGYEPTARLVFRCSSLIRLPVRSKTNAKTPDEFQVCLTALVPAGKSEKIKIRFTHLSVVNRIGSSRRLHDAILDDHKPVIVYGKRRSKRILFGGRPVKNG